jgi:hypothetical protein
MPIIRAAYGGRTTLEKEAVMPLPTLTEEQRKEALAKAAEARKARAEIKAELKAEKMTLKDVLSKQGDDIVGKMKVSAVLEALPGVGKVRARKIMEKLDISATRRVRGLGAKQKDALLAEFAAK